MEPHSPGRALKPRDRIEYKGGKFKVERMDGLRIRRVRFTRAPVKTETISLIPFVFAGLAAALD
jgi:hypothetical protein